MKKTFFLSLGLLMLSGISFGLEYADEIRDQVNTVVDRAKINMGWNYFHDMGIIARKSDDAEMTDLTSEIVRKQLLQKMQEFINDEISQINDLFQREPYQANERLAKLTKFERFFQPTEEYQNTAAGKQLMGELVQQRKNVQDTLSLACVEEAVVGGIKAMRNISVYHSGSPEEITSLKKITQQVDCCLGWKKNLEYENQQQFETDYDAGTLTEEGRLKLTSSPNNLSEAKWEGEWIYKFKGRDGVGEGVSRAILSFKRGSETADLVITASKVSSAGRMNFPRSLAGEPRTLNVTGTPLMPRVIISTGKEAELTGCDK